MIYPGHVLLTYVDESHTKERYYIAALLCPDSRAISLTRALDDVVRDAADDAELHGHELFHGKGGWLHLAKDPEARIKVYAGALQAIADHDLKVIVRGVDITGLHRRYSKPDHPHSVVMTHLLERIDAYADQCDDSVLIIADEVDHDNRLRADLRQYRSMGTWGYRSRKIRRVVDTIHFAPSSASRLVQAADLVAYFYRRRVTVAESDNRAKQANEMLWNLMVSSIHHVHCWYP